MDVHDTHSSLHSRSQPVQAGRATPGYEDPTSQNSVLQSFELLELIFSYFEAESDEFSQTWALSITGRHNLLNAALTCKVFFEPAMNVLWRSMESLAPLVKVLPTFVMIRNIYTVDGAILQSHIDRIGQYARRIRRLRLDSSHNSPSPIPSFIYEVLHRLHPRGLLPALTHLFIPSLAPEFGTDAYSLCLMAWSSLSSLEIDSIESQHDLLVASILRELFSKAPALRYLTLSRRLTQPIVDCITTSNFCRLTHLTLNMRPNLTLEPDFLPKCSKIARSLSSLAIVLPTLMDLIDVNGRLEDAHFSKLLTLRLCGSTSNIAGLFPRMHLPSVQHIVYELYLPIGGPEVSMDPHFFLAQFGVLVQLARINQQAKVEISRYGV